YNATQVKPEEVRLYDDLLNPKWKGKIGVWDPREGGAAAGEWAFLEDRILTIRRPIQEFVSKLFP
ncbi:MAG: hypothetical protein ACREPG_03450, partial [Candidatus Binatia bacterium]